MSRDLIPEVLPEDKPLPFWDHVGELRDRLIRAILALFAATSVAYFLRLPLWRLAVHPFLKVYLRHPELGSNALTPFAYTDLAEPFFSFMRLSFWTAVLACSPYLFYQVWAFIKPALRERERSMATGFVAVTSLCFVLGVVFAYFALFPELADLLLDEALRAGLRANLRPEEYLNLFLYTLVGTGLSFETPVLFYFLARFGFVNSRAMLKYWREATIVILFVSAFLTPGDVVATTILFGVVLLALYFISAGVVWFVERRRTA
ncbi:MAG: twin-arginine translocase subunit TatC [Elusimicrobia bacterium]|nr:twin-arginine translocase subunit TatC [Elusimicrobiota bacterium]